MTKNLETADTIVKLVLSVSTLVLFFTGVIVGPFAQLLVALSVAVISISLAKHLSAYVKQRKS